MRPFDVLLALVPAVVLIVCAYRWSARRAVAVWKIILALPGSILGLHAAAWLYSKGAGFDNAVLWYLCGTIAGGLVGELVVPGSAALREQCVALRKQFVEWKYRGQLRFSLGSLCGFMFACAFVAAMFAALPSRHARVTRRAQIKGVDAQIVAINPPFSSVARFRMTNVGHQSVWYSRNKATPNYFAQDRAGRAWTTRRKRSPVGTPTELLPGQSIFFSIPVSAGTGGVKVGVLLWADRKRQVGMRVWSDEASVVTTTDVTPDGGGQNP